MHLGIVGRGYWGNTYARVLKEMRIPFWQDGRYWHMRHADGIIVACKSEAHYEVARCAMGRGAAVLIEKPVTLDYEEAKDLSGGIAFAGYTRLYSRAWRAFKEPAEEVNAWAGGVNETNADPVTNWVPHLAAMCLDLGAKKANLHISAERRPLTLEADGKWFTDVQDDALVSLIREFCDSIEKRIPDNRLKPEVVQITEALRGHSFFEGGGCQFRLMRS